MVTKLQENILLEFIYLVVKCLAYALSSGSTWTCSKGLEFLATVLSTLTEFLCAAGNIEGPLPGSWCSKAYFITDSLALGIIDCSFCSINTFSSNPFFSN